MFGADGAPIATDALASHRFSLTKLSRGHRRVMLGTEVLSVGVDVVTASCQRQDVVDDGGKSDTILPKAMLAKTISPREPTLTLLLASSSPEPLIRSSPLPRLARPRHIAVSACAYRKSRNPRRGAALPSNVPDTLRAEKRQAASRSFIATISATNCTTRRAAVT